MTLEYETVFAKLRVVKQGALVMAWSIGLAGCGGTPVVPVDQRNTVTVAQETERIGGRLVRIVQADDTLYSIAFEAGLDFRELASWNGIGDPYLVDIGQKVRLTRPLQMPRTPSQPVPVQPSPDRSNTATTSPVISTPAARVTRPAAPAESFPARVDQWDWPATGVIFRGFGPNLGRKGIDIVGQSGQKVSASAQGKVVYAGNGLRGYGNLVIVKHNNEFLSAYAHNRKIFVREGEWVARGQKIGEMGDSGAERVMLHFEIRRTGKPVDPREYLPKGGNTG